MKRGNKGAKWSEFSKMRIKHTIITKDMSYEEKTYREWKLAPFEMTY